MATLRVLIAEDEPVSSALLKMLVEQEGHVVCGSVAYGSEVPAAVARTRPDVVLMDVHLADDISGISATRDLVKTVSVPVIVISGTDSLTEMEEIAGSGALGFIKKPVSADELRVNLRLAVHHNDVLSKVRASELLHRSLFDGAAVGIYACHPDGYYLACNQAFARMLGYAGPADLLRSIRSIDEQVYVEEGRRELLLDCLRGGNEVTDFESEVYGREGDLLWVSEHLAPARDEGGNLLHYEGVVIDVTDKVRARQSLRLANSLLRHTVDAIASYLAVTDLEGNIILSNKAFERGLGRRVGPERKLLPLASGGGPSLFEIFLSNVAENPRGEHEVSGYLRFAGEPLPLRATVTQYCNHEEVVVGAVFVMRPIGQGVEAA